MLNKLFQEYINQMSYVVDVTIGILDENGIIISCSQPDKIGVKIFDNLTYTDKIIITEKFSYKCIANSEFVVFVEGDDKAAENLIMILALSITNIKNLYDIKFDKNTFVKNIILDNIPTNHIYIKARKLSFKTDVLRSLFLIKTENNNTFILNNMLRKTFPDNETDYIFTINEQDIILVYEIKQKDHEADINDITKKIVDTISSKHDTKVCIGVSGLIYELNDIARSFQEAQTAIEVGKLFDPENNVSYYEKLGIGRLIFQLPETLCKMYLEEILKDNSIDSLEPEIINSINSLFENNFNVLESSKKLFIHRNTLVYRLEKIRKLIGLDLSNFNQALTFKIAMMIQRYLDNIKK